MPNPAELTRQNPNMHQVPNNMMNPESAPLLKNYVPMMNHPDILQNQIPEQSNITTTISNTSDNIDQNLLKMHYLQQQQQLKNQQPHILHQQNQQNAHLAINQLQAQNPEMFQNGYDKTIFRPQVNGNFNLNINSLNPQYQNPYNGKSEAELKQNDLNFSDSNSKRSNLKSPLKQNPDSSYSKNRMLVNKKSVTFNLPEEESQVESEVQTYQPTTEDVLRKYQPVMNDQDIESSLVQMKQNNDAHDERAKSPILKAKEEAQKMEHIYRQSMNANDVLKYKNSEESSYTKGSTYKNIREKAGLYNDPKSRYLNNRPMSNSNQMRISSANSFSRDMLQPKTKLDRNSDKFNMIKRPMSVNKAPAMRDRGGLYSAKKDKVQSSMRQRLPLITLNKTFLLTKFNFNRKVFNSSIIFNDSLKNIVCFELITHSNYLMIITSSNVLFRFKILEINGKLFDEESVQLNGYAHKICQIGDNKVLVPVFKNDHSLIKIYNPTDLSVIINLKLKERVVINQMVYFDDSFLFVMVPSETKNKSPAQKVYLFDTNISSARRCFMLSGSNIIDCFMPTRRNLFVGCDPNELKFFKINFGSEKPFVFDYTMKVPSKIKSLEIFHKNDTILLANCIETPSQNSVIYIINTITKETINTIRSQDKGFFIHSLATVTILTKKPEIYLLAFSDNQIKMCDIDSSDLTEDLPKENGVSFNFNEELTGFKLVKILSQRKDGNIKFIGLSQQGLIMINVN